MTRRNHIFWIGLLFCLVTAIATSPEARSQSQQIPADGDIHMPSPRARRRVPRTRSRVTSRDTDRARQALLHSRPAPSRRYIPKHQRVSGQAPIEPIPQPATEIVNRPPAYSTQAVPLDATILQEGEYAADSYVDSIGEPYVDGPGEIVLDETWQDGGVWESCDGGNCGGCDECCGSCSDYCGDGCTSYGGAASHYPLGSLWSMGRTEFALGIQGFRGPYNQGDSGSFGFQQAFNYGTVFPLFPYSRLGWQIGTRTTQSNLSGTDFSDEERHQTFFTTGVFRRNNCGWQGGLVVDVLEDDWYAEANVTQLRGELSLKFPSVHEWGYRFSAATSDDVVNSPLANRRFDTFEGHDLHSFFYRRRLTWVPGGVGSFFAGFSGDGDGYIGAKTQLPLSDYLSLRSSFSYLIPDEPTNNGGTVNEAWNLSMAFVFNLRGIRPGCPQSPYTPLFDVADNGNFIVRRTGIR